MYIRGVEQFEAARAGEINDLIFLDIRARQAAADEGKQKYYQGYWRSRSISFLHKNSHYLMRDLCRAPAISQVRETVAWQVVFWCIHELLELRSMKPFKLSKCTFQVLFCVVMKVASAKKLYLIRDTKWDSLDIITQ